MQPRLILISPQVKDTSGLFNPALEFLTETADYYRVWQGTLFVSVL